MVGGCGHRPHSEVRLWFFIRLKVTSLLFFGSLASELGDRGTHSSFQGVSGSSNRGAGGVNTENEV